MAGDRQAPLLQLLGRKAFLVAPELGVWWDSPQNIREDLDEPFRAEAGPTRVHPAFVSWGTAVPTLASLGTPLCAALLVPCEGWVRGVGAEGPGV